ncbi:PREDICTED: plasma kallikrein-like [Wasmannia auropunctata]|uniref:plasma kallikrein-like n=1 Tax=Wasmannia auropunctata TaxID=64793 RepID=UPI0005EF0971|nr:PREDICTED: plasma kallikrein-like [Wasmannia auropunctata]
MRRSSGGSCTRRSVGGGGGMRRSSGSSGPRKSGGGGSGMMRRSSGGNDLRKILTNDPLKEMTLCSGSSILYKNCTVHTVINFFIHENYNNTINDYDVAVLQVKKFTYDKHTKAVALASNRYVRRKWGIICGWGYYQKFNGTIMPVLSKNLQCATVPLINNTICQKDYANRYIVTPRMTCYGFQEGGIDACQGDSGGALVNIENVLLGITSWGDGCADKYSPGVYTDMILLRHWIRNKTEISA